MLKPTQDKEANDLIKRLIREDVAHFDCKGDCPDEVAIYGNEHYGETIRTDEYCNECFTKRILEIIEGLGYYKGLPPSIEEALNSGDGVYRP